MLKFRDSTIWINVQIYDAIFNPLEWEITSTDQTTID